LPWAGYSGELNYNISRSVSPWRWGRFHTTTHTKNVWEGEDEHHAKEEEEIYPFLFFFV
jgi:hypothetical protein